MINRRVSRGTRLDRGLTAAAWNKMLAAAEKKSIAIGNGPSCIIRWGGGDRSTAPDFIKNAPYPEMFEIGRAVNLYQPTSMDYRSLNSIAFSGWHMNLGAFLNQNGQFVLNYDNNQYWHGDFSKFINSMAVITDGDFPVFYVSFSGLAWFLVIKRGLGYGYIYPRPDGLWEGSRFGPVKLMGGAVLERGKRVINLTDGGGIEEDVVLALGLWCKSSVQTGLMVYSSYGYGIDITYRLAGTTPAPAPAPRIPARVPEGYPNLLRHISTIILPSGCRFHWPISNSIGWTGYGVGANSVTYVLDIDC